MSAEIRDSDKPEPDSPLAFCADFARELSDRQVSLRQAAKLSGWGKTTIETARKGPGLPNEDLVCDVLAAIGVGREEVERWRARHQRLAGAAEQPEPQTLDEAERVDETEPSAPRWRKRLLVAGAMVATLAILAVVVVLLLPDDHRTAVVMVQNKVAIGASTITEDDSPSYLSSKPVSRCANVGCKLPGTEVYSGDMLTAYCQMEGEWLTNADLGSEAIKQNPNLVASPLWYGIEWSDGRRGYISEVYIAESYRGGLGLPPC